MFVKSDLTPEEIVECDKAIRALRSYSDRQRDYLLSKGESIGTFKKRRFIEVDDLTYHAHMKVLTDKRLFNYLSKAMNKLGYTIKYKKKNKGEQIGFTLSIVLNQHNIEYSSRHLGNFLNSAIKG